MAAPVIESFSDLADAGGTTTPTWTKPTGLALNDLLLLIVAKDDDVDMEPPDGTWTEYRYFTVAAGCSSYFFYKLADSGDVAASNFVFTGDSESYVGRLYRISNVNTATPIDADDATGALGTSTAPQAPSIDTVTDDALVFAFAGMDDNDTPYSLDTAGWTEDYNTDATTSGIVIGYKVQAIAGATGAVDFTTNASDGWHAAQIAIKSADAAGINIPVIINHLRNQGIA